MAQCEHGTLSHLLGCCIWSGVPLWPPLAPEVPLGCGSRHPPRGGNRNRSSFLHVTLNDIALKYGTDKSSELHGYCPWYERHIVAPATLLELGIYHGASLRMWEEYLPGTRVMGVEHAPMYIWDDLECHLGDATDPATYDDWMPETVDVIIDDASHWPPAVLSAFKILWPRVSPGGWYVVEDLRCAFDPAFGGQNNGGDSMVLVNEALHQTLRKFSMGISEFHAYEEIVFIRKAS